MFDKQQTIEKFDAELWKAMQQEDQRQEQHIELIASENYTSPAVMEAQGTKLPISMPRGIQTSVTTAVVSMLMWQKSWPSKD